MKRAPCITADQSTMQGATHQNHGGPGTFSVPRPPVKYKEKFLTMTEIEKMKKYIERTKANISDRYEMDLLEVRALRREPDETDAIYTAFLYGRAKGYRAAKAEGRARS